MTTLILPKKSKKSPTELIATTLKALFDRFLNAFSAPLANETP